MFVKFCERSAVFLSLLDTWCTSSVYTYADLNLIPVSIKTVQEHACLNCLMTYSVRVIHVKAVPAGV
jgi:hypothetical protein